MTLVSFVIPNYNHAAYVAAAIDSALAQSHADVEVVVVDDGSTDESRAVIGAYGARVHLVCQANQGLSAARNTGIRAASGEYIALLDADDLLEPRYAERLLAALAANPQAAGAYCGFRFVDQNNRPLPRTENRVVPPAALYGSLLNGNYWVPESLLMRREAYGAMGEFDTALRSCEDWDVWLRFSRHYTLVGIEDVLVRYRVVLGSMSSNPGRMLDHRLRVLLKHVGERPQAAGTGATHQAYANAFLRGAVEYCQAGDAEAAYDCLLAAVRLFPALARSRATYAELLAAGQERGSEGSAGPMELHQQRSFLLGIVGRLAADLQPSPPDAARAWQAQAYWALAQLHYAAGSSSAARSAWWEAGKLDPSLLRDQHFLALGARTALGSSRVATLKRLGTRRGVQEG